MFSGVIICSLMSLVSAATEYFCKDPFGSCLCDHATLICENQNFTKNAMEKNKWFHKLDSLVEKVIFTGNQLEVLERNMFIRHNNIKSLNLSFNNIEAIDPNAFNFLTNLTTLILDFNRWDLRFEVPAGLFKNLLSLQKLSLKNALHPVIRKTSPFDYAHNLSRIFNDSLQTLEYLSLESNDFVAFDKNMFCHMPALTELRLSHNSLKRLKFNLACTHVKILAVDHNFLPFLTKDTTTAFSDHSLIKRLELQGNPFYCDCHMIVFREWLKSTEIEIPHRENFKCQLPKLSARHGYPKVGIFNVTEEEMICYHPKEDYLSSHMTATYIVLGVVCALMGLMVVFIFYMNWKRFVRFFSRLDYTEIVRRDSVA